MADLTQNPLFSFVPEDVVRRQKEASRQAYSGSGYQSLGYGLGRLFGAGNEARAAEVKAAQDREDILAAGIKAYPDSPYKAYTQVAKGLLDRGDTTLAQQYMEQANRFRLMDEDQRMQKEAHNLRMQAGRAAMEKDRAYTIPEVSKRDITISKGVLKQAGILGSLDAPGWASDTSAEDSFTELLATEANKMLADQKYGKGPKITQTQAVAKALEKFKGLGIVKSNPSLLPTGDNWDFDVNKYNEYLGITQPGEEIDPRVKAFMDANKITDRKEAEDILKKHGKL